MKWLDLLKKNALIILLVLVSFSVSWQVGVAVVKAVNPGAAQITGEIVRVLVSDIVDEQVQPALVRIEEKLSSKNDFPVKILELEMNRFCTADEVNDRIDIWESQVWGVQLAAMKYVAEREDAREELKKRIIYQEVYLALMKRTMKY